VNEGKMSTVENISPEVIEPGWVLVVYGIRREHQNIRERIRTLLRRHGFVSCDLGGSVYLGVRSQELDERLNKLYRALVQSTGQRDLVHFITGEYDVTTALKFTSLVDESIVRDMQMVKKSINELEEALAGNIVLKDSYGNQRNLVSVGESRIRNALLILENLDTAVQRLSEGRGLQSHADELRQRVKEMTAWVRQVKVGFDRFAAVEKARQAGQREVM
jgi:virulence-associated protein VapD